MDAPVCGYKGDPVCFPPNCGGACPISGTDTRPEKEVEMVPLIVACIIVWGVAIVLVIRRGKYPERW